MQAHKWIHDKLPILVKKRRSQRREDVLVSYADGPGKSGAHCAALYANANEIAQANVITISKLENRLSDANGTEKISGLVIIDDMIGTGTNLVERLSELSGLFKRTEVGTALPFSLIVLCSTVEGERKVRKHLADSMPNADLEVCELLESKHFAFNDTIGFWETENEKNEAKALLTNLGALVQKRKPLGYGNQGLLLTFSRNCPNNSLPILHGHGKGNNQWTPLFPRMRA